MECRRLSLKERSIGFSDLYKPIEEMPDAVLGADVLVDCQPECPLNDQTGADALQSDILIADKARPRFFGIDNPCHRINAKRVIDEFARETFNMQLNPACLSLA